MKRVALGVLAALVLGLGVAVAPAANGVDTAAASPSFDPGYIISDGLFYDANAMTEGEIQAFLDARIGTCLNSNCLNVVRVDSTARLADAMCAPFDAAVQERASRLIFRVQQACGISAKVLLVTLQKEQSLVTHQQPSAVRLDRAMGYACPDSPDQPGWCDPRFGGLSNQVYRAAWQFKRYANPPGTSNFFTWFPVGTTVAVRYHPNADCGAGAVRIQNRATAALYYYTPYQPNAAALANMTGTGDSCSAYGNRNFWRFYSQWFGSSTGQVNPVGVFERLATEAPESVRVSGWTLDPDVTGPLDVHVYVNGAFGAGFTANGDRGDVRAAYPNHGGNYGFDRTISVAPGRAFVCVYALNQAFGANVNLGCRSVDVAALPPAEPAVEELGAVYRFWSARYEGHFYTRSVAERDLVIRTYPRSVWQYEGPVFGAYGTEVAGTTAVYRFWSAAYQTHFYTASVEERDSVIATYPQTVWQYEGVAFYALPLSADPATSREVSRFWSPTYLNHFFTASAEEARMVRDTYRPEIWTFELHAFRVPVEVPAPARLP